LKLMKIILIN